MQLLDGEDRAPLVPWRPPEIPEERVELEWGAESTEQLAFVAKKLCDGLAVRLEGRAMAAARLELVLALDRAFSLDRVCTLEMVLPTPIAHAPDLCSVVRARLERHTLQGPVVSVRLRAPELARIAARPLDMFSPEPKADRALPRLVAELSAELGCDRVGRLGLVDTWIPEERSRLVPMGEAPCVRHVGHAPKLEPSRLVAPSRVYDEATTAARLLSRIEAVEWWRTTARSCRDFSAAWLDGHCPSGIASDAEGPSGIASDAVGALAWLEVNEGARWLRGWFD
jgi:protein ImuB